MAQVVITNVALVIRKGGRQFFQQSIDTKSGYSLILPNRGDNVVFNLTEGQTPPQTVEGKVDKILFGYWFNGMESLTEAIEIELV